MGICLRPDDEQIPSSSCLDIPKSLIFSRLLSPTRQFLAARSLWETDGATISLYVNEQSLMTTTFNRHFNGNHCSQRSISQQFLYHDKTGNIAFSQIAVLAVICCPPQHLHQTSNLCARTDTVQTPHRHTGCSSQIRIFTEQSEWMQWQSLLIVTDASHMNNHFNVHINNGPFNK